jgi:hypothetical protein
VACKLRKQNEHGDENGPQPKHGKKAELAGRRQADIVSGAELEEKVKAHKSTKYKLGRWLVSGRAGGLAKDCRVRWTVEV